MLLEAELKLTKKRNYQHIKELIRISFGLGVNLTSPTRFKEWLRVINIVLLLSTGFSMYGHWSYLARSINNLPVIAESICTGLQAISSWVKLFYYLFVQHQFYLLIHKAQTHEILLSAEVFHKDFPISSKLKVEAERIMDVTWRSIRRQFIFFTTSCTMIISDYFFSAVFKNLYHQLKHTPNYEHILPFPSYYPVWKHKGMDFPYYHIQMFVCGCADYIAGMAAVSFDGVFLVLSLHSVGLIEVLKLMVESSTSPLVPKERRVEYMRYCIMFHHRTFEYINEVNRIFKHISLAQFILSLVILGIVLFNISVGLKNDKYTVFRMIMYIAASGYDVVIFCYNGQTLTTANEGVPLAFYNCEWYNESEEFKELVRMMILRTNRTFLFNISWFTTMCLPTLVVMARASGSYFLLLRNLSV